MNQCLNCGYVDIDSTQPICPQCGNAMPGKSAKKAGKVKKSKQSASARSAGGSTRQKKPIALFAGIGVAAVGLVVAAVFLLSGLFGGTPLASAAENSIAALVNQLGQDNNLITYMQTNNTLSGKSDHHILLGITTPDIYLGLDTNYAGSKKLMDGTIQFQYLHDDTDISVDFHANNKEVRLYAPDLVSDVYGFTYKDFEKNYDKSQIRKLLGLPTAKNLKLKPFQGFDLVKYLEEQGGDSWDAFVDTLTIEEFDTRQIQFTSRTEECTIYRIKWDAKKAEKLIRTLSGKTLGAMPDFLLSLASDLTPDVRCYVNADDVLVGVDFTFLNSIYTFLLEGQPNPWDLVTLKVATAGAETRNYSGGVYTEGTKTRIEVKSSDHTVYAIYHDSSDGTYSMVSPLGEFSNGIYRADNSGFYLESNFQNFSYIFSVTDLYSMPSKTSEKYVELTDMSFSEASRLVTEVCSSFGITLETLLERLGVYFGN